uniref:Pectate lyase n=1 Tax=viral metagenome TaxID=1070528 RepID=A0A6M3LTR0_9ZZZZ
MAASVYPGLLDGYTRFKKLQVLEDFQAPNLALVPNIVYVDGGATGLADGTSWANAFTTIQAALDSIRKDDDGDMIYDKDQHHLVLVFPGHYDEQILTAMYNVHILGLGNPGTDYGVAINYTPGTVTSTCVYGQQGSGNTLENVQINNDAAIPTVYIVNGDNNKIVNCVIRAADNDPTYGILALNAEDLQIIGCEITGAGGATGHKTAGIAINGGDMAGLVIADNRIMVQGTGAKGIYIAASASLHGYGPNVIARNFIDAYNAGATAKGIDVDHDGRVFVHDNCIVMAGSAVGIEHAGLGVMANNVSVNGTMQGDSSHSFVDDGAKG